MRCLLRASIRNATVTRVADPADGFVRIDEVLLHAAGILSLEEVDVVVLATGGRFRSVAVASACGSGEVAVATGERNPVRTGDRVAIQAFGYLHDGQTIAHAARVVTVGARNELLDAAEVPAAARER